MKTPTKKIQKEQGKLKSVDGENHEPIKKMSGYYPNLEFCQFEKLFPSEFLQHNLRQKIEAIDDAIKDLYNEPNAQNSEYDYEGLVTISYALSHELKELDRLQKEAGQERDATF
jgi:hypothetical protein